jgi:hypothetical protein
VTRATCVPGTLVYREGVKRRSGGALLAATLAALGGCGSSSSKSNAPATATAACVQLESARAHRSARCQGGALADWQAYALSQDDCAAYDRHVAEHQAEYRPGNWDACLAEYEAPCDRVVSNCFYEILHGLVADGQHCQDTGVCGTYSACFLVSGGACGEVCVRAAVEGEACGLYCGGATPCLDIPFCATDLACSNGVCVKTKAGGASCGGSDPTPCEFPFYCTVDLADPQASGGVCTARQPGGFCHVDADCVGTEFCLQETCTVRRLLGESCADAPSSCVPWTACDTVGVCVAAGKPGLPCATFPGSPDFPTCSIGTCFDNMQCTASANAGGSCSAAACAPGSSCDQINVKCLACGP